MTWRERLEHRFVERIPRIMEAGVLYISMAYATAAHSCACGCGEEVMTPFTPTDWKMTFDGEAVSLWPSVGNWQLPCRSHYVIRNGQVLRAGAWTQKQVAAGLARERAAKMRYYGATPLSDPYGQSTPQATVPSQVGSPENSPAMRLPVGSQHKTRWFGSPIVDILRKWL